MSTALVGLVGLILAAAYILVVYNRASSTVVGAALSAAAGLVSALVLVFTFNRPTPVSRSFSVAFIIEEGSFLPIQVPDRPFPFDSLGLADEMRQLDPKTFEVPNGGDKWGLVMPLYHEFLQKVIVHALASRQFSTWRMKTERFVGMILWSPMADASSYKSRTLDEAQLQQLLGKNRFARLRTGMGKWALPPQTEVEIKPPKFDAKLGDVGIIHFKNPLCDLSITTTQGVGVVGLGKYTEMLGLSAAEAQKRYFTLEYIVRINASFAVLRSGDVNMDVIKQWANAIVDELSFSFDEESIWNRTKENFLLRSHLPQLTPGPPSGPIRFVRPPPPEDETPKTH